ncbi:hypothetical protein GCM10027190_10520 [Spirosoma areae]
MEKSAFSGNIAEIGNYMLRLNFQLLGLALDMKLTAVYLKVPEGYVGFVEELPGANTQGETLEEARINLQGAVQMV